MIITLDASAAVEIVLQTNAGKKLYHYMETADWVLAPSLLIPEVTNVFWKYYQFGNLSMEQCEKGIEFSLQLPDEFSDDKILYKEAFALACQTKQPAYDMFYLVLARRNNSYLMTLDKKLSAIAEQASIRIIY